MAEAWVPMNAAWWPDLAAAMAKPWPREAVLMDLRWWADQERLGRLRRPGRPALRSRWGWTDYATHRALLAEDDWGSPLASNQQASNSRSTAGQQPVNSKPTGNGSQPVDSIETAASESTVDQQQINSRSTEDRPTRVLTEIQRNRGTEEHTPPPTPPRGQAHPRPLASVLAEAWAASPNLRPGAKGPGLAPVVPLEWHEAPAERWLEALEAYLKGTRDGSEGRWKPCAQTWGKWLEHGASVLQWVQDPAMDEPSMGRRYVERDRRRDEESARRLERANRFRYEGPRGVDTSKGRAPAQPASASGDPPDDDPYSLDYLS